MPQSQKLVFLPGMDGTGLLFKKFQSVLQQDIDVIPLPSQGAQDYANLANYVISALPDTDCIIVVESFSGGLIPYLLQPHQSRIVGVIFVASFISSPNKVLLPFAQLLPIKSLLRARWLRGIHRWLLLDSGSGDVVFDQLLSVVEHLPEALIKARLKTMAKMSLSEGFSSDIPAVYLQPSNDKLVGADKAVEIMQAFTRCQCLSIEGPHFILQAKPYDVLPLFNQALTYIRHTQNNITTDV